MHPADLIPVLKALHADPRTAGVFADWFEERGDETLARWMRAAAESVFHGDTLLRLMQRHGDSGEDIAAALAAEAHERLIVESSGVLGTIYLAAADAGLVTQPRPGVGEPWTFFDVMGNGPMILPVMEEMRNDFWRTGVMPGDTMFRAERVEPKKLSPITVPVQMLDGNCLMVSAVVWCGTLSNGVTVFGRVRKEHLSPVVRQASLPDFLHMVRRTGNTILFGTPPALLEPGRPILTATV